MLLAEVEIRHSRPVAPTRRVALGLLLLPTDPLPGWGPVLIGGLLAANVAALDADELSDLYDLIDDLEAGNRISQPKLRHRFQKDTVGLDRSRHSLIGEGEHVWFDLDDHALPEVNILGALYPICPKGITCSHEKVPPAPRVVSDVASLVRIQRCGLAVCLVLGGPSRSRIVACRTRCRSVS